MRAKQTLTEFEPKIYADVHRGNVKKASLVLLVLRMVEEEEKRISSKGWSKMIRKVIIDASIEPISDTKYQIVVASTDNPEQLKQMLSKASSWRE